MGRWERATPRLEWRQAVVLNVGNSCGVVDVHDGVSRAVLACFDVRNQVRTCPARFPSVVHLRSGNKKLGLRWLLVEDVVADGIHDGAVPALVALVIKLGDALLLYYSVRVSTCHALVEKEVIWQKACAAGDGCIVTENNCLEIRRPIFAKFYREEGHAGVEIAVVSLTRVCPGTPTSRGINVPVDLQ